MLEAFLPSKLSLFELRSASKDSIGHRQEDLVLPDQVHELGCVELVHHDRPGIRQCQLQDIHRCICADDHHEEAINTSRDFIFFADEIRNDGAVSDSKRDLMYTEISFFSRARCNSSNAWTPLVSMSVTAAAVSGLSVFQPEQL